jgi:hypothetical protein
MQMSFNELQVRCRWLIYFNGILMNQFYPVLKSKYENTYGSIDESFFR